jgi:cytochrome c6
MTKLSILAAALGLAALASPSFAAPPTGQTLFLENCSACHQPTGLGRPGAFPALAGDKFVTSDPAPVAAIVLNGRGGMPAFKADLNDADLAAILSYVRTAWGNKAAPVAATQIAAVRAKASAAKAQGLLAH